MIKLSKVKMFFLVVLLLTVLFHQKAFTFDDGDFQYWNTEEVSFKINEDWKVKLEEEFRFGDDAGNFYYQHSDWGVTYSGLAEWFDLGVFYRHIFEETAGDWEQENRPHLDATVKWELLEFPMSDRGRFEYRNREDAEDSWRYRNKFTVKWPHKITKAQIQPYIADEIFVDFDDRRFTVNRLYTGFSMKLFKNLKADIFYLWQAKRSGGTWLDYNILGTNFKLSF